MNLLITGAWKEAKKYIEVIEELGNKVVFLQFERDNLPCEYEWVEGVIGNGLFLYHSIEKFTNLRYIQLTSAGFDRVSIDYVKEHNIRIFNARGVYSIPMAEFTISGVLQLLKQSRFFMENQKKHKWEKYRELIELSKKYVCIVGCGSVGTECAKRFKAFGCTIKGVDLKPYTSEYYDEIVNITELDNILEISDIIILTLPLTDETKHLMNAERLRKMKETAILVNISRGAVVEIEDLIYALDNKQIAGAVLDVFEREPLNEDSPLWEMENVVITPHNSFEGDGNKERLEKIILKNMRR